jgi:hypothetical protein
MGLCTSQPEESGGSPAGARVLQRVGTAEAKAVSAEIDSKLFEDQNNEVGIIKLLLLGERHGLARALVYAFVRDRAAGAAGARESSGDECRETVRAAADRAAAWRAPAQARASRANRPLFASSASSMGRAGQVRRGCAGV